MDIAGTLQNLSAREKLILGLTIFVALFVAPYFVFYAPARENIADRREEMQALDEEIAALASSVKAGVGNQGEEKEETPALALPEAKDLAGMLTALGTEADLAGVDFISVSQEGSSEMGGYVKTRLKLELRSRYRPFHVFVKSLGDKHRLFMIQSLRYETNEAIYPSGVAIIKAVAYLRRQ
ncbi:MAG: type 4a pilus biogenesis protein PilO [Nitrospirota bacterium]|jgi:hypothetical protein